MQTINLRIDIPDHAEALDPASILAIARRDLTGTLQLVAKATDIDINLAESPESTKARWARRTAQVIEDYTPWVEGWADDSARESHGRYILIEENTSSGGYWITRHDNLDEAARYHDGNEYPGDYNIIECIDLETGQRYEPETTTKLTESLKVEDVYDFDDAVEAEPPHTMLLVQADASGKVISCEAVPE